MEYNQLQKHIAQRVRNCRKEKRISQEKLSELAGLGIKAIQNIENQKYDFKIQTLEKVIKALDITVEDFFDFQSSDTGQAIENLLDNLAHLPKDKQLNLLSSFNDILKNIN